MLLTRRDRYGIPVRTAMCLTCGLVFLVDRLTQEGYEKFYRHGLYRKLITSFSGINPTLEQVDASHSYYARRLLSILDGYIPQSGPEATLLDVGGSTGITAKAFSEKYGFKATVLDPAVDEIKIAESLGVEAVSCTLESWETSHQFDMILLCRSIEHLFDLDGSLRKIRQLIKPTGLFYCDIADFLAQCRIDGCAEVASKIDHVFWLTQETAPMIFRHYGFEPIAKFVNLDWEQVGFLLKPCPPQELVPVDSALSEQWIRKIREMHIKWIEDGKKPLNVQDSIWRVATYWKRMLAKWKTKIPAISRRNFMS